MNDIPKTIEEIINVLAAKFGKTGKELWDAILFQQKIRGCFELGTVVIIVIISLSVFPAWLAPCSGFDCSTSGFSWFLFFGLIALACGLSYSALTNFLNPVYAAISDILSNK